ncbi:ENDONUCLEASE/EXONUCLEASE/PHOSPHATASE FAMILY PROTEIN [Salix purpurea]|uniref:ENDONUCLEASE/EXONUCLEASE/PHOSPHATASE FAMILY PROTEIN n=1 Tax=Salix purpurea TaxID=77065 RepID=A0A9Q0SJC9_SALPP|nr:ENDONUCLEASE/EXONUCLEASE/PHOSPHATASE FAMILY PROTEIN [Salix purpurea]
MVAVVDSSANSNIGGQLNSGVNESNLLSGNGTISRNNSGCGYVSSTTKAMAYEPPVSCTTFNILAPIYKRVDQKNQSLRESNFRAVWLSRNQKILNWLLHERSSIICLQEFWVDNEELVHMYQQRLGDAGYVTFQLARTNNRGDGLLTAVLKDHFTILNYRELLFNDCGDRVAQLLHVQLAFPFSQNQEGDAQQEFLLVNTHLLFPHDSCLSVARLHQVYKILQHVEQYQRENKLNNASILLCGDWNGSKRGQVYKFLRSQGFVSSYDIAHQYTDSDADSHRWVSHRNHRGNICGVDFILLCNPNKSRKPLKKSWAEAVFGIIKVMLLVAFTACFSQLFDEYVKEACMSDVSALHHCKVLCIVSSKKASLIENNAFVLLKPGDHGNFLTYSAFCEALRQVNLIGVPYGLTSEETKELWMQADINGNGVVEYEEFKRRVWNSGCAEPREENCSERTRDSENDTEEEAIGFNVKNAVLFPREAEKGMWPENYSLSDHARLTVVFSPVRMQCSQRGTSL